MFQFSKPELINYSKATERTHRRQLKMTLSKKEEKNSTEMPIIRHELLHVMWPSMTIFLIICKSVLIPKVPISILEISFVFALMNKRVHAIVFKRHKRFHL